MCFSAPKPTVIQQAAPAVVTPEDKTVLDARDRERRRLAAQRSGSTLLSGGNAQAQPTQPKQLLAG